MSLVVYPFLAVLFFFWVPFREHFEEVCLWPNSPHILHFTFHFPFPFSRHPLSLFFRCLPRVLLVSGGSTLNPRSTFVHLDLSGMHGMSPAYANLKHFTE